MAFCSIKLSVWKTLFSAYLRWEIQLRCFRDAIKNALRSLSLYRECIAELFVKTCCRGAFWTTNHRDRLMSRLAHLVVALLAFTTLSLQDFSHCELQALHLRVWQRLFQINYEDTYTTIAYYHLVQVSKGKYNLQVAEPLQFQGDVTYLVPQDSCMLWLSLPKYKLWFLFSTGFSH